MSIETWVAKSPYIVRMLVGPFIGAVLLAIYGDNGSAQPTSRQKSRPKKK